MLCAFRISLWWACLFLVPALPATAAVVNATWGSATDLPVTASSYTATGSTVNFTLNYAPVSGINLTVVNSTGASFISGTFDNLAQGQAVALSYNNITYNYVANYYGGTGNDLVLVGANTRVLGWGYNLSQQIINDTLTTTCRVPTPVFANGVLAGKTIVAVAAGNRHSLALCSDGTLAAWGSNYYGELGDNTNTSRSDPVLVNTVSGVSALHGKTVVAIAAGYNTSFALCSDGTVAAWGDNTYGVLGDNSYFYRTAPVAVNTASGVSALYGKTVVAIAAGYNTSFALCSDGTVAAWGDNTYGVLGDNSYFYRTAPVAVNTASGVSALYGKTVVAITAGESTSSALCSDGSVASWGSNTSVPVPVNTTSGTSALYGKTVVAISSGPDRTAALCSDGTVAVWGYTGIAPPNAPVQVNTTSGVSALYGKTVQGIALGFEHSAALCTDGTLVTWGYNTYGQLGTLSTMQSSVPVAVDTTAFASGEKVVKISSGPYAYHTFALTVPPPDAPMVATLAVSGITTTGATLNGTVNANGRPTTVSFEYGPPPVYGNPSYPSAVAAMPGTLTDSAITAESATLSGLTPGRVYHYRIKAVNDAGTIYGSDSTFTTLSNDATLSSLSFNNSASYLGFSSTTTSYTVPVPYTTTAVTLRPTATDTNASITVNGTAVASGSTTAPISLSVGSNTLAVLVTAQDGTTLTYTVTVTRAAPSTNAALNGIQLGVAAATLSPTFSSSTLDYTATVAYSTSSMWISASQADAYATMKVNGTTLLNNHNTEAIPLNVGSNLINIVVTAQDGTTTQTYTITVTRPTFTMTWNSAADVALTTSQFIADGNALGALTLNFTPDTGASLMLVNNTGPNFIIGTFSNLTQGQAIALTCYGTTYTYVADYYGGTGNDLVLKWANNRAMATGYNSDGQLGDGTATQRSTAVPVTATGVLAGKTILALATGGSHSLALCSDGTLAAWGDNASGQLGDGTTADRRTPVAVNTASDGSALYGKKVVAIAAGQSHSLALCSDGSVATWGDNTYNQLGNGNPFYRTIPFAVSRESSLSGKWVVSIAAGARHNLVLCSDGTLCAWGSNTSGQLGDNSYTRRSVPVAVSQASGISALNGRSVQAIAAAGLHSLALCTDGTLVAWGNDVNGELGDDNAAQAYTSAPAPVVVKNTSGSALAGKTVAAIAAGYAHNLALCTDGSLIAWGQNTDGQLGNNSTDSAYVPVFATTSGSALAGKTVTAITAGASHSLALCSDGTLTAWGLASSGQLGSGSTTSTGLAVAVSTAPLGAGEGYVMAGTGPCALHTLALHALALPTTPPQPPLALTLPAAFVSGTTATLRGQVNVGGAATSATFDYGTTTAYGQTVSATLLGSSTEAFAELPLTWLQPSTTYHYRINATNALGAVSGSDMTFTTLSNDAILSSLTVSPGMLNAPFDGNSSGSFNDACYILLDSTATSVTITPTARDSRATIHVNGSLVASGTASTAISVDPTVLPIWFMFGNDISVVVTAQDGTTRSYLFRALCLSKVEQWRFLSFGSALPFAPTGDADDYDNDGICNLLEYALNLSPTAASKLPASTAVNGGNYEYTYTRSTAAVNAGTAFTVEWNVSLSAGSWSSAGVTQTVLSDDGITQQVKAVIPMNAATSLFVHLSVTAPP